MQNFKRTSLDALNYVSDGSRSISWHTDLQTSSSLRVVKSRSFLDNSERNTVYRESESERKTRRSCSNLKESLSNQQLRIIYVQHLQ